MIRNLHIHQYYDNGSPVSFNNFILKNVNWGTVSREQLTGNREQGHSCQGLVWIQILASRQTASTNNLADHLQAIGKLQKILKLIFTFTY